MITEPTRALLSFNAGKSTILRSIQLLQPTSGVTNFFNNSLRIGTQTSEINLELADPRREQMKIPASWDLSNWKPKIQFSGKPNSFGATIMYPNGNFQQFPQQPLFYGSEPNNFIYPYFSHRKTTQFQPQISASNAILIEETFQQLPSKLDRLLNPDSPFFSLFRRTCDSILDLKISCDQWENGKQAGLILEDGTLLPINNMGEGITESSHSKSSLDTWSGSGLALQSRL